ncbi:peptidoglycan-associated lipoprotein Pal [Malikia sp.]|uniref:peptidoglycan-associated lipoprotein Pal n=1 Tax=Malikia sp. TaxID=2070706 RepID=UPI002629BD9B|nr:peptidoglycan-associated lipoprotein Pal [Malikia sp.]MDD2728006.1 peptidoglycan-associated lipoprotein Pal [Malikia sp.]
MTRLAAVAAFSALLAACGSSVKLQDTPVAERSATAIDASSTSAGAGAVGMGQRDISGVQADRFIAGQAPANVERIVYFDFDSYAVRPEFSALIDSHAKFINGNSQRRVNLEGHTDERGGREYNLALGQKRAEAVLRALVVSGVSDSQMEAVSFGKEKPAAQGSGEEAWAKNRRVELTYR